MHQRGGALWPFLPGISLRRGENPIFQRCWMRWWVCDLKFCALVSSLMDAPPTSCFQAMNPFPDSVWKPFLSTVRSCLLPDTPCPPPGGQWELYSDCSSIMLGPGYRNWELWIRLSYLECLATAATTTTSRHHTAHSIPPSGNPNSLVSQTQLSYFCACGSCNSIPQQRDAR